MKMSITKVIAAISLLLMTHIVLSQNPDRHVVVVTIDGFRPNFYLEDKWDTPNLKAIKDKGAHAYGVNSVFPSITYPSHTTIVTGVQPSSHGIFYNAMFEKDSATKGQIYWHFDQITSPTLWEITQDAGLKAASVNWPVSVGAPTVFNISDVGSKGQRVMEDSTNPAGISTVLRQKVLNNVPSIKVGVDKNVAAIAAWVIKTEKPNFMTVHLLGMDHAQHVHGRNGPEVEHTIVLADSAVGVIRKAIREAGIADNTLLIITGDHGFLDVNTTVSPNVWLKEWGLMEDENSWKAKFHTAGGGAFLFLKDKDDKTTRNTVMAKLKALPDADKKYFQTVDRKKLNSIGADPNVALGLSGLNGAAFSARTNALAVEKGKGGTHGYFPDTRNIQTGFVAEGRGLKQQTRIQEMDLKDISAIVVEYLGLRMPSSKGKVPKNLFE
ncbi:MAG TPA: ectonucleotide pyrophosphatase/phosphodiesterase [Chryseosolibacter sp.]|nr:ectonucleotide pyrophosphatase/phosphodiesterase [Chryseosolibacter sp.]